MDVITDLDEFTADVPIPEDLVDDVDATTVVQGLQAIANRTKYLHNRRGPLYLVELGHDNLTGSDTFVDNAASSVWADTAYEVWSGAVVALDELEVEITFQAAADGATAEHQFRLGYRYGADAYAQIGGALAQFDELTDKERPVSMIAHLTAPTTGTLSIALQCVSVAGVQETHGNAPMQLIVRHWRPTT